MQVVSEHFRGSGFKVFAGLLEQEGNEIRAIPAPKGGSRAFCDRMNAYAQAEGLPGMGYIFWREGLEAAGPIAKALGPERTEAIRQQLGLGEGDAAFFLAGQPAKFEAVAGKARNVIGKELGLTDEERFDFCWIVDFPMYEKDPETGRSTSATTRSRCRRAGWRRSRRCPAGCAGISVRHRLQRRRAVVGRGAEPQAGDHVQGLRDRRLRPGASSTRTSAG